VLLCVLGGLLLLVGLAFKKVRESKTYQLMRRMYRVGRVKLSVILFNCQVRVVLVF
jgi:hypothetical protein